MKKGFYIVTVTRKSKGSKRRLTFYSRKKNYQSVAKIAEKLAEFEGLEDFVMGSWIDLRGIYEVYITCNKTGTKSTWLFVFTYAKFDDLPEEIPHVQS